MRNAEQFEETQQRLVDLQLKRQGLLKTDKELADQLDRTLGNISDLQVGISSAIGGQITIGSGGAIDPIVPGDRADIVASSGLGGGGLSEELAEVSEAARIAEGDLDDLRGGVSSLSDELAGAVLEGRNWGDTLSASFRKIAQTWLSQGIESILLRITGASVGGGGGVLGQVIGGLFGARAQGGGVRAGQIYQVNENTPNSEWLFASGNGGVLNHGQMNSAVKQAMSGQGARGEKAAVQISLDDGLKAEFLNDAAAQSLEITRAGISGNNQTVHQSQRRR
ncbi:MAG: hypothetical protein AAFR45_06985 [Pseudomonadota bacterium]